MRAVEHVPGRLQVDPSAARRALVWCGVRRWALVVWGGMALWSAVLFAVVGSDYHGFRLARFDLGNMVQAVWSTAHGRPLEMTSPVTGEQVARFAFHVDPILALLTPLWLLVPSPLTLAAVQIVVCALGALPVYWLARRHLGSEPAAALLALAYLAYPWLAWSAVDPIHPVTFAVPLFLYAIWFLDLDRLWAFAPFAILAALCGELTGLSVAALGIWYALSRGHRVSGAMITVLGATWSIVAVKVIVPAFLGANSVYYSRYESVGGSPGGMVKTLVTDPGVIFAQLFSADDFVYWVLLSVPLLGLFVFAPGLAAVSIPQFLINDLSDRPPMVDPRQHYVAAAVPFLVAATVLGLARLSPAHRTHGSLSVLGVSLLMLALAGPLPGGLERQGFETGRHVPAARVDALHAAVALVPDGEPVTSTNAVGANLSARRYVYSVPVIGRARWAVIDRWNPWMSGPNGRGLYPARLQRFVEHLQRDLNWATVFDRDGVVVLKRVGS